MEQEARPPYVIFETRPIEDREQSVATGRYVAKDVIFAIVTPAGTKDRLEKLAEDWLRDLEEAVRQDRFPAPWFDAYKQRYEAFLRNEEIPEEGTPIREWAAVSPAQAKNILGANIRTVEDLAQANEEALLRIGMGARALKDKAQAWLDVAEKRGKPAEELAALRAENEDLKNTVETLTDRLARVETQLASQPAE